MLDEFRSTYITWDKATSRIYSPVTANASDENGRKLVIQVVNSGQVEDLTGATLHLYWETRDKAHDGLDVFKAVDLKKGEFELSYTTGMLSNHGVLNANLVLIDTVGRVVSERFKITVTEGIDNDAIQSENSFSSLTQALIDVSNLEQNYAPRLNDLTAQLQQTEQELSAQLQQKASKIEVNDKRSQTVPITLQDIGLDLLNAIENKEGETTFELTTIPKRKSVSTDKVSFIHKSNNLINDKTFLLKKNVSVTGEIIDSAQYNLSDFISVIPQSVYTSKGIEFLAYYDKDKQFISRPDFTSETFTTLSNSHYVRIGTISSRIGKTLQLNEGNTLKPFDKYSAEFDLNEINFANIPVDMIVNDGDVKVEMLEFVEQTSNLYNKNTDIKNQNVFSDGSVDYSSNYHASDFIKVEGHTHYTFNGFFYIGEFDEQFNFIKRTNPEEVTGNAESRKDYTLETTANTHYIKATYGKESSYPERRINKGTVLLPYEEYRLKFKEDSIFEPLNKVLDGSYSSGSSKEREFMFNHGINDVFTTEEVYSDYTNFRDVQSADVYAMFDTLMSEYPDYLSKNVLQNDELGNEISLYATNISQPPTTEEIKTPTIFINCGIHGYEHASTLATYLMLKEICENWKNDKLLEVLRFNVNFLIIPVANPSGWNAFQRVNHNGVDVNRNFPDGWVQGTEGNPIYGGSEPFSEIESRNIRDVLNTYDIDIALDFHNFFRESNDPYFLWIPTPSKYRQKLAQSLFNKMSRLWAKRFDFLVDDYIAGYTNIGSGGTASTYMRETGEIFHSYTFEICNTWVLDENGTHYDDNVCRAGVEALVNWLLINLNNFKYE